jgi:hypothetical protein
MIWTVVPEHQFLICTSGSWLFNVCLKFEINPVPHIKLMLHPLLICLMFEEELHLHKMLMHTSSHLLSFSQSFGHIWDGTRFQSINSHMHRFSLIDYLERGFIKRTMLRFIVQKFCHRKLLKQFFLETMNKTSKVPLQALVHPLGLSIHF